MKPPRTECRHEGCTQHRLEGAIYCGQHIGVAHQCKATRTRTDGTKQRCKKPALLGLDVCERHGGRFKNPQKQHQQAETYTTMQRFVRPYEGDLNPVTAFEMEFRRTLGRIAWYDEQLAALASEEDLIWGETKYETAGGKDGVPNHTYEARINLLEEMQRWERKHLLEMEKVWISAGLEQARLDLMRTFVDQTYALTERALRALGIDTTKPEVRQIMASVFAPEDAPLMLEARHEE